MPEAEVVLAAYSRERSARFDGLVDQGCVDLSRPSGAARCIERRPDWREESRRADGGRCMVGLATAVFVTVRSGGCRRGTGSAQMELAGAGHSLGAAGDAQFLVHVADVGFDGVGRHVQLAGDLAQGEARGQEP